MNLTYEAIDTAGRPVRDLIEADNVKAAVEQLRQRGLMVTHVEAASQREVEKRAAGEVVSGAGTRLSLKALLLFTRQMAMLLTSGSAVVPALSAIARNFRNAEHVRLINYLRQEVEEGSSLCETLRKCPRTFSSAYCAVIAAGESSATLPAMFDRLARLVARRRSMRNRLIGSLAYPVLLTVLCLGVINVLLFFVLPRFGDMFIMLNVPLPSSTRFMLRTAELLLAYWPVLLGFVLACGLAVTLLAVTAGGRQWCADVQIHVPLVGRVMSRLIQGQMFRTLGMLLEARVGVLEALDLSRGTTRNSAYQGLFDSLEGAVTSGASFSDALERSQLVDPSICQAVRTGEESGNLGGAISYAADVLDEDNSELVQTATRLIEPVIIIVMGLVVGVVAVSLFMPLFDITTMVN